MAATQAEPQQNDVNRDIAAQQQSPSSANNSLQNGTDKTGSRGGVLGSDAGGGKVMKPAQNISVDMSQYRQDSGPPVNNSEQNSNNSDDSGSKVNNSDKPYGHNAEPTPSDVNYGKIPPESGANMQGYGLPFPQRANFMHPDSPAMHMGGGGEPMHPQSNSYGHFGPGMRHPYVGAPGSKPLPRPGFPQQRIMPAQNMSSPPAGTPTLNQLLQSNSVHNRYPNSYGEYGMPKSGDQPPSAGIPYSQNWPPPRPMPPYSHQNPPYRHQPPPVSQGGGNSSQGSGGPAAGQQNQSGNSQPGQPVIQCTGGGGGQQPGPGQPPPRPYPGYPSSPSQSPYHPPSPYRHSYQMGGGGGSNGGYERGGSWSPGPGAPPQHDHPSSPSPQQPPPSQQQQPPSQHQSSFQSRGAQQSPNAHAPDPAELTGQNSNDSSSGGGGGGTPNSGGGPLRPSPSPTGSSGSRSMSPAVLPPGGGSQQQQGNQQSQSGAGSGGGQPQAPAQQSVVMPPRPPSGQSDSGNGPSRLSHSPMAQPPAPPPNHPPMQSGHPPMGQPGHPSMGQPGHGSVGQQTPPGGYQGPGPGGPHYKVGPNAPAGVMGHMPSPNIPPQSQQIPPYSPQPPHHQYPQQSNNYRGTNPMSYVGPYSGGPPQSQYPPHRPAIPNHVQYPPYQHKVGGYPPSPGQYGGVQQAMGPPSLHPGMPPPPPPHHDGPMPPPASTPSDMHDAPSSASQPTPGATVTASSNTNSNMPPGVTSLATTVPDASLDEASQQSTLSNASAASGDDTNVSTPNKVRAPSGKEGMAMYQSSHPTTPQSTAPSPGTASINSMHEEYPPDHSPTWSRTPNSPVFNSHVPQDLYRPKKHDSLSKLYEMDDSVDRRMWLDKLLQFMDERGTPISSCPTISKNPLDLFRLYIHVKERGGFMEVCKVTKNKVWKDIAGLLGIGASSSAAYTLRKHYTKNLLPFECHFDRGGIDPQPIINQVEASSKKKTPKAAPVPSPGSSNSQDSFQGPGSGNAGMDGYPGYGYQTDYNNQRPTSQTNQGVQQGYPGGYSQYGDQYNQGYGGYPGRPVYSGYNDPERTYPASGQQDQYRYMGGGGGYRYPTPPGGAGSPATPPQTVSSPAPPPVQSPAAQPEYYRPPGQGEYPPNQQYPQGGKTMPPPQPGPRRHPDFIKDQSQPPPAQPPYPPPPSPYNQQPHRPPPPPNMYPGWNNNNSGQYRNQYPGSTVSGAAGWANNSPRPGTPNSGQWPPGGGYQPSWAPPQPRPPRPQHPPGFRPSTDPHQPPNSQSKQYPIPPPPGSKPGPGGMGSSYGPAKRELSFPEGSVEGTAPVLCKRRRLCKTDVAPVDAWRIMMALKSGLLAETTWALDVLNILLFDDSTVTYFGLLHLPGLLDILLEHMKVALQEMLEPVDEKCSEEVDLGEVEETPDPSSRTTFLHRTPDMTLRSRKGHPVVLVSGQEDIFIRDGRRPWDPDDSLDRDHPDAERVKYIVSSFKSEVCNIPFTRTISGPDRPGTPEQAREHSPSASPQPLPPVPAAALDPESCDKNCSKTKIKSLSYALSRIKKERAAEEERNEDKESMEKDFVKIKNERLDDSESKDDVDEEEGSEKETKIKEETFDVKIKDPSGILRRRRMNDYEDESYSKDEASLYLVTESQDWLAKRCICISTILRNLTFVPGNEAEYSKSSTFLSLVGKLLLLHHEHPPRQPKQRNYDRDEDADTDDSCSSLAPPNHWWWDFLHHLRENALVSLANISGQVDLGLYAEEVSRPILDGLLHWAVCPAAHGQDPFPTVSSSLSPQRLALEALCKLCVTDSNVDLVIATPPYCRLERLASVLTRLLCRSEEQVLREFGVNLLFYLGAADSGMARTIALQAPCISLLVGFVEQAESGAVGVANTSGLSALRENPDQAMGTSVDMVRRACRALLALARHPSNRPLIQQHEHRLLHLVMSQVLDQSAAQTLAKVLYQVSRPTLPATPPPPPPT